MSIIDAIRIYQDELTAIRQDFHANPELGLEEHRTAEIVAQKLESWGIEVHRGVGRVPAPSRRVLPRGVGLHVCPGPKRGTHRFHRALLRPRGEAS